MLPKTINFPFQLGEPVEHRGIVIAPLFPTRDPGCTYVTLDEALPQGLAITETSESGPVPGLADPGQQRHVPGTRHKPCRARAGVPARAGPVRGAAGARRRALPRCRFAAGCLRTAVAEAPPRLSARRTRGA